MLPSCKNGSSSSDAADSTSVDVKIDSVVDSAQADTLAMLLGTLVANDVLLEKNLNDSARAEFDAAQYAEGVAIALSDKNKSASYTYGVQAARDLRRRVDELRQYGVDVNIDLLIQAIRQNLQADSISEADLERANTVYNNLLQHVYSD
ncbi:MAG: hypothetical protein NC178_05465 [Bacteroides sp.]|nr:hypothetical protein [Bacteroides sp.]